MPTTTRRSFLGLAAATALRLPLAVNLRAESAPDTLRIGLVADVHHDVIHDGHARLLAFTEDMKRRSPDLVVQMGDFAIPHKYNQPFLDLWHSQAMPKYHILGNHDMDDGFNKKQVMEWYGMERSYYSFDRSGFHIVVLDGNDPNPRPWKGYDRYIGPEQQAWLAEDLSATKSPVLVLVHQSLEHSWGVANGSKIRAILEAANRDAGWKKVFACLSGHSHCDYLREIEGIPYVQINSMSYFWVGGDFARARYPEHIERAYPLLSQTIPYRDPLYTMVTLDPAAGTLHIEPRATTFVSPGPHELEHPLADELIRSTISERTLAMKA